VAILIESLHTVQNDAQLDDEDPDLFLYLKTIFGSQLWGLLKKVGLNDRKNETEESKLRDNSKETILERFNKLVIRLKKVFFSNIFCFLAKLKPVFIKYLIFQKLGLYFGLK